MSADVARLTAALEEARSAAHASEQKPHEARPGSSNGDAGRTRAATAELIPAFASDEDYLAGVTQLEPWRPALDELLAREGITPHGSVRVATTSAYATFYVPPDHYAKIYLKRLAGHERHAVEIRTLRRLQNEPGLPAPKIVGEGRLGDRGRYLVMTRLPGKDVESLRASLDEQSMERIVAWSGAFLRRLRDIPIEDQERDEAWDASIARLANMRGTATRGLRTRSGLPERLIEQVEGWLPTGLELLGTKERLTLTHGAFGPGRVIIDIEAGAFEPTGVIDFNASFVTHPMSDFAAAWAGLRSESTTVVDAFMREAAFPEFGAQGFPGRALAWAILQGVDAAYAVPDMDAIGSLDELAAMVFGRANGVAAEPGTGAQERDRNGQDLKPVELEPDPVAAVTLAAREPSSLADVHSDEDWRRLAARAEPWLAAAAEVSRRSSIQPHGSLEHLSGEGQFPAVLLPPDHIVKFYSTWLRGHDTAEREVMMLQLLKRDPNLPVPTLVGEGELEPGLRYVVMSRVRGVSLGSLGRPLDGPERHEVATWTGEFLRTMHGLAIEPLQREIGWQAFDEIARWRYAEVERFSHDRGFSPRFLEHLRSWMPPLEELMGSMAEAVVCHGDLNEGNLMGRIRGGRFEATGVVDLEPGIRGVSPRRHRCLLVGRHRGSPRCSRRLARRRRTSGSSERSAGPCRGLDADGTDLANGAAGIDGLVRTPSRALGAVAGRGLATSLGCLLPGCG